MADNNAREILSVRRVALHHLGLVGTLSVFALMVVKVTAIARLDATTMQALFVEAGPIPIAISVLSAVLPVVLTVPTFEALTRTIFAERPRRLYWMLAFILLLLVVIFSVPLYVVVAMVTALVFPGLLSVIAMFRRFRLIDSMFQALLRRFTRSMEQEVEQLRADAQKLHRELTKARLSGLRNGDAAPSHLVERADDVGARVEKFQQRLQKPPTPWPVYAVLPALFITVLVVFGPHWQPPEVLERSNNDAPLVGYVLSEGEWLTVMREDNRRVERIAQHEVVGRTICTTWQRRRYEDSVYLWLVSYQPADYPECPEA